ncbi:DUF488 domain-containing protein [Massilia sp. PAMC28688]|uniref:DUF488 domain-containing protein n=1 Tax=Massilia sp. PAMC28688 TaxID=2861283 RepID=UPI001C63A134|nr:DUF488 domain-containing protein [Massilia sp. PAMC28688]QYF92605.1 DUF488 domain-containing protein [Massilia sp. PAMC28688]
MTNIAAGTAPLLVCTIGHSTRPLTEFVTLLTANGIDCVVDVRTVPRSRHNPQYNQDALPQSLAPAGIAYQYFQDLGGLRHASKTSTNTGWRNASFRGYADHMQSPQFHAAVEQLVALAQTRRCVLMCAESVPWRCHRSMIGDALLVRGLQVEHIVSGAKRRPHKLTPFAHVQCCTITYPAPEETDE